MDARPEKAADRRPHHRLVPLARRKINRPMCEKDIDSLRPMCESLPDMKTTSHTARLDGLKAAMARHGIA